MRTELKNIGTSDDLTSFDYFIGTRNNQDGTYTDRKFTYAQVAALASGGNKVRITVSADGNTITNSFFESNAISIIFTDNAAYMSGVAFSQDGDTITGITISFYEDQELIAQV